MYFEWLRCNHQAGQNPPRVVAPSEEEEEEEEDTTIAIFLNSNDQLVFVMGKLREFWDVKCLNISVCFEVYFNLQGAKKYLHFPLCKICYLNILYSYPALR
jgi:hypothetical protein